MDVNSAQISAKLVNGDVPVGHGSGPVGTYTQKRLLVHEANKKTRHIPIRQLVRRSGEALQALKPCFLMSPLSVAQYLSPGDINFDLVVMDEASQMRPEDALGAIARADKAIVVGDPKQLPPTSFFDSSASASDDEEEETGVEEVTAEGMVKMPVEVDEDGLAVVPDGDDDDEAGIAEIDVDLAANDDDDDNEDDNTTLVNFDDDEDDVAATIVPDLGKTKDE